MSRNLSVLLLFWERRQTAMRAARPGRLLCSRAWTVKAGAGRRPRMYVPADGLSGESPEQKAAGQIARLFTFVSARIVQAQMEGLGNDGGFAPQATGEYYYA